MKGVGEMVNMSYSTNLKNDQINQLIKKYKDYELPTTNNYTLFRAKYKSVTITIFKTNTILFQGLNESEIANEISAELGIKFENERQTNTALAIDLSLIGTDEVGTGDFFGGVVVCSCFVPKEKITELQKKGVRDSKELTDNKIIELAPYLMENLPYSVLLLDPMKYNYVSRVKKMNMNKIKAYLHNSAIKSLKKKNVEYNGIIIDAFTTSDKYFDYLKDEAEVEKDVKLIEKAESKFACVASASIIARYVFLKHMDELSKTVGFDLPKGAGNKVDLAINKILKTHQIKYFDSIAKTNFKNLEKLINN